MAPDRSSPPPSRPPRDRHGGGSFAGPRRNFGGGGFSGAPREGGPRPPFIPRPPFQSQPPAAPTHSVRLRDGEREVEVSGTPEFVRQTLDDLPTLLARLRGAGEATATPTRPASISLPPPPRTHNDEPAAMPLIASKDAGHRRTRHSTAPATSNGHDSLEDRVFDVLERAVQPLSVAAIREQLADHSSGQQIRRILERAGDRVVATSERPAAYALR